MGSKNAFKMMEDSKHKKYFYHEPFGILVPLEQRGVLKSYKSLQTVPFQKISIADKTYDCQLLKTYHARAIYAELQKNKLFDSWKIKERMWFVDDFGYTPLYPGAFSYCVYNGRNNEIEHLAYGQRGYFLEVIYIDKIYGLRNIKNLEDDRENNELKKENAQAINENSKITKENSKLNGENRQPAKENSNSDRKNNKSVKEDGDPNFEELLNCDKRRCGLASYDKEILYDIRAGHWDVFENPQKYADKDRKMVGKDPRKDIKKNGIIGIDFGTKSTVVVKQEGRNEIRPIRIGSLSLSADVTENDYENPTIISCMSIENFLKHYEEKQGRPETSCEDIFVSYNAYEDYKNCLTENFYSFYSELKQWANKEKEKVILQDSRDKKIYRLAETNSIEETTINPIEIYAYYIGMYINNMKNGIYLKYIMSFPVNYSKDTKELIRKSFEKGLKKSLPNSVVEDAECMKAFSVKYEISEPAAYAVTALEQSGFAPESEEEKYLYGIFDFGGGTTDFDFGIWRGASDNEYDKYNCDYVLECFGADSDVRLGGENILEMLAYYVFKENKGMASEKKIACALPIDEVPFIGSENLINNSQSANRNLTKLKEALRPLWEQHDNWKEKYHKKNTGKNSDSAKDGTDPEYLELQMYDFNGTEVPNCKFKVDTEALLELIKKRIQKGVYAFFQCMEKSILYNESAQCASEKIYIFLAGNSCKSKFVKEIFDNTIEIYNKEYGKGKEAEQDRFELIEPLKSTVMDEKYVPNAKTGVAYGLVKSRPGGKIYIIKNYETDSNAETRFKYYLGGDRRGLFNCKLSPIVESEDGISKTSYNIWKKFQGAGMGIARIYYTDIPGSDLSGSDKGMNKISIDDIPFHEISFEADENKYLFVRAVKPTVIEYTIAESEDQIGDDIYELDMDAV